MFVEGKCKWSYGPSCPVVFCPLNIHLFCFVHCRGLGSGGEFTDIVLSFILRHDEEHNDIVTRSTATAQKA